MEKLITEMMDTIDYEYREMGIHLELPELYQLAYLRLTERS